MIRNSSPIHSEFVLVVFDYELPFAIRGREYSVDVLLEDHTGSSFASFEGDYHSALRRSTRMESDRPRCRQGDSNVHPTWNMAPGDYDWNLSYAGSTWLSEFNF